MMRKASLNFMLPELRTLLTINNPRINFAKAQNISQSIRNNPKCGNNEKDNSILGFIVNYKL